jgi:glycosyltransferase involved in cell wall biosynthesis
MASPSLGRTVDDAPPKFSIIVPAHNEGATIASVLRTYTEEVAAKLGTEILVCEDGSTDNTRDVLETLSGELPLRVVTHEARLGYAGGVKRGLSLADGDVLFFSDSDGQYDPRDFWRLYGAIGSWDMVIGQKTKREEPLHRIALSKGFHLLVKLLFDIPLKDIDCGFRLIRREVVRTVLDGVHDLPYSFWGEFTILASLRGFRVLEIPVSHRSRLHGNTTIYEPRRLPQILVEQLVGLLRLRRRMGRAGPLPRSARTAT